MIKPEKSYAADGGPAEVGGQKRIIENCNMMYLKFPPRNEFFGPGLPCEVVFRPQSLIPPENGERLEYRVALYPYLTMNPTQNVTVPQI